MNRNDQEFIVQKIRSQYTEKESTTLDALRRLDAKVKIPANIFAYLFGSIGTIIMGSGMSFIMTDIGLILSVTEPMIPGVVFGLVGMLMVIINYPIYKRILSNRRQKYADEIVKLSDKIMSE